MRFAWLILLAACAARPVPPTPPEDEPVNELAVPLATFRWSLAPVECHQGDLRSTVDTCHGRDALTDEHLIAVYAPISDTEPAVAVIRYEGDHVGGPARWQQNIDLGTAPHSAVVTVVREAVIVAAVSRGGVRVVAIDNVRGRILGSAMIVGAGAQSVQLEGINDFARIHVRTAWGGAVAVMHPRTAHVLLQRFVDERSIIEHGFPPDEVTSDVAVTLAWENRRLVVRRGEAWMRYLRVVATDVEEMVHRASLRRVDDRVFATVHDTEDGNVEVFAFDRTTGEQLWRSAITGGLHFATSGVDVRTAVDGDQLVVHGNANTDSFVCSIGLADGIERACVDRLAPRETERVFDFRDDVVTP